MKQSAKEGRGVKIKGRLWSWVTHRIMLGIIGIVSGISIGIAILFPHSRMPWSSSATSGTPSLGVSLLRNAPLFELPDASGKMTRLEELRGSVIILHFWASWCPPCLDEIPQWVELGTAFQGRNVKIVAVSQDQNWQDAQKILPSQKLLSNTLSLLDTSAKVSDLYGTFQFPETYLLDADLHIVLKWVGPQDWGGVEIRQIIEKTLSKRRP